MLKADQGFLSNGLRLLELQEAYVPHRHDVARKNMLRKLLSGGIQVAQPQLNTQQMPWRLTTEMTMDKAKCKAYWAEFVASLPSGDPRTAAEPDAFGFGGEGEIADELAALVLADKKRATASLPKEYTALGETLPKAGDLSIVLDGKGNPVAIIERTSVALVPFHEVTAEFAATEGEGDGSLEYWQDAHTGYFGQVCERLGGKLEATTPVLCQCFKVVWPMPPESRRRP